eukprot:UN09724
MVKHTREEVKQLAEPSPLNATLEIESAFQAMPSPCFALPEKHKPFENCRTFRPATATAASTTSSSYSRPHTADDFKSTDEMEIQKFSRSFMTFRS